MIWFLILKISCSLDARKMVLGFGCIFSIDNRIKKYLNGCDFREHARRYSDFSIH
jgi:hypothetical protein